MPLWTVYEKWGWGTEDAPQLYGYLRRFGSVTILNGHIHQIQQKVEGHITLYTARSTAYPQPPPGVGPAPGPLQGVTPDRLRRYLGIRSVRHVQGRDVLAVTEEAMA
ncbi:MAG TPA: metallophosphoesterase, partial [Rhodanobacter sp.]